MIPTHTIGITKLWDDGYERKSSGDAAVMPGWIFRLAVRRLEGFQAAAVRDLHRCAAFGRHLPDLIRAEPVGAEAGSSVRRAASSP
jgi:hypothetical protein